MLDQDFQNIFTPIYYLTLFLCSSKYTIRKNFILTHKKKRIIITIVANCLVVYLCYETDRKFLNIFQRTDIKFMYIVIYTQYGLNYFVLSILNLVQSEQNVRIILKLQEIERCLHDKNDLKTCRIGVMLGCIILMATFFCLETVKLSLDPLWFGLRAAFLTTHIIFDLDIIYVSCIVYFLALKMERWTQMFQEIDQNCGDGDSAKKMLEIFKLFYLTLNLTKKCFQLTILLHIVTTFFQTLLFMQILLVWLMGGQHLPIVISSHTFGVFVWISKEMVLEVILCIFCEALYRRIEIARYIVVTNLIHGNSKSTRILAKNALRITDRVFTKITACGLFTVDATLPLGLASVVATYTVVLLQFAFL